MDFVESARTIGELYEKYRTDEPIPIADEDYKKLNQALFTIENEFRTLGSRLDTASHMLEQWRGIFTKKMREAEGIGEFAPTNKETDDGNEKSG